MSTRPYYSTPGAPEQMTGGPLPVQMAVAAPAAQERVTVLFRVFMIIPHAIVLYFLGLVAGVVAFLGWWAALFTGRLPEFAQAYLTGYIQWYTRVHAYLMLLTDVYPPFTFDDDPAYPVRVAVPPPGSLNRAAVFFRVFLVFPVSILAGIVLMGGMTIVGFIAWLITLVTGQLPDGLHLAYASVIRYVTRVNCYSYLLTAAYPGGLFGDGQAVPPYEPAPPPYGAAPPYGEAPYGAVPPYEPAQPYEPAPPAGDFGSPDATGFADPGYAAPGYNAPGYPAPGGYGVSAGYGAPASPAGWRLVLTEGARQLAGLFAGIGAVLWIAWAVLIAILIATGTHKPTSADVLPGYQRIGGSTEGISVAVPASWVQINPAQNTIENGIKKLGLPSASESSLIQAMQSLQSFHPAFALDVQAAVSSPHDFAPNLNAYCVPSGVTDVGSAGVPFVKASAAAEFQRLGMSVSQLNIEIGGVPGVETRYNFSSSIIGAIYGAQLEVLPKPNVICFATATSGSAQLSANLASVAAQTAQFP